MVPAYGTTVVLVYECIQCNVSATRTYEEICILIYLMVWSLTIKSCMIVCDSIFHLLHLFDSLGLYATGTTNAT